MTDLNLSSRRANVVNLRAKATTDDERWICDEFARLFDTIDVQSALLREAHAFISEEADNRAAAGSETSDYEREPRELAARIAGVLG